MSSGNGRRISPRRGGEHPPDLHYGQSQQFPVGFVHPFVHLQRVGLYHRSAYHPQVVDVGILAVRYDAEDIDVVHRSAGDGRSGLVVFQTGDFFFDFLGLFKLQRLGVGVHFPPQFGQRLGKMPPDDLSGQGESLQIFLLALVAGAGGVAALDVVFQTGTDAALGDVFFGQVGLAGTQRHQLADHLQQGMRRGDGRIRAVVFRAVVYPPPGEEDAGEALFFYADPRVGLVVLEQDVVARAQGFDQVVFQQQRIGFALYDDKTDVGDLGDHHARLGVRKIFAEIGQYALLQVFGFAHVQDFPFGVVIPVHAGVFRDGLEDQADVFVHRADADRAALVRSMTALACSIIESLL